MNKICIKCGKNRHHHGRGMCSTCYRRWHETQDEIFSTKRLSEINRFWHYVEKSSDCWNWKGGLTGSGYAIFATGLRRTGTFKNQSAHRYAFELVNGAIPDGLQLDHLCRNTRCVNPEHLEAVTPRTNYLRGFGVGAVNFRKTHCLRGHPFDEKNTYKDKRGSRYCKQCRKTRASLLKTERSLVNMYT